ncbi:GNAT family N-acetyltransferase [Geodermatophilus nigrescens]|uniref:L-amino acid N-acyltransferase YncA n=1 Tax=Geodermatophilus nigrescens TaxID=1070870 RepID=A0A1M5K7B4_9ACTN|nr:GNAT family N-acetyltransferase [Geodermatophilus nigrescens]SHG48677.1 L-amino acid N-acyltransferase YncA [Geodermatophilus nigrescens]
MEPRPVFPRLTGSAEVSVRPALPSDAADVARVQELAWRSAPAGAVPGAVLESWDGAAVAASWAAAVTDPPSPRHEVLVALDGDQVVGFAAVAPAEPQDDGPVTELVLVLVEPRWGRRGHGSRLLAAVADRATAAGAVRLVAWLAELDTVTAGFLESAGWDRDGWVRTLDTGADPLREVRWHTLLGGGA